jgi:hypothetical protein
MVRSLSLFAALLIVPIARADVRLPHIISDHMVLQRDLADPIWGWADEGEEVRVSIAGQSLRAKPGADGKWQVKLAPIQETGPLTLTVQGKNTLKVQDILVGEVWLASGQSNMAWKVSNSNNFAEEKKAAEHPQLRMFTVMTHPARTPQTDCRGVWQVCSPETVGNFSATAYFFGRDLQQKLNVPVGLINSSVGGTPIEAWTSMDVQKEHSELSGLLASWDQWAANYNAEKAKAAYDKQLAAWKEAAAKAKAAGKTPPRQPRKPANPRDETHHPAVLYNGMIAPLVPYDIRGAIWYQGESNAGSKESGMLYKLQLQLMVQDWRSRWSEGDFPFAWVQLPNFTTGAQGWPYVRESMLEATSLPHTGMTVNIDIGEHKDIHPKNKQDIGKRLALWALANVYGQKIPWSGPLPAGHKVQGNEVVLSFKHTNGGLVAKDGTLRGFQIAGADKKWHTAEARIQGNQVVVSSPDVKEPTAVRYDWANDPNGNLFNGAGLPASPFRTDKE